MRNWMLVGVMMVTSVVFASGSYDTVDERIKPVGKVLVEGDKPIQSKEVLSNKVGDVDKKPAAKAARDGKAIYTKHCSVCHATGVAGAPKFQDSAAWGARAKKPIAALVSSVKKGLNAMPPGGMCMDCTDTEYEAAIKYMLPRKST